LAQAHIAAQQQRKGWPTSQEDEKRGGNPYTSTTVTTRLQHTAGQKPQTALFTQMFL